MSTPLVDYEVIGGERDFTVPFPYLSPTDVYAYVNGESVSFQWLNSSQIRVTDSVVDGALLTILRNTPIGDPSVTFQNGSVLTSEDLNKATRQILYKQQELTAFYDSTISKGLVRGAGGGLVFETDPEAIKNAVANLVLETEVLDRFRAGLDGILQHSAAIINESLGRYDLNIEDLVIKSAAETLAEDVVGIRLTQLDLASDLTGVRNFLAPGGDIDARIISVTGAIIGDTGATADTVRLLGARTPDLQAFILDVDKVLVSPSESLAVRFTAIQARSDEAVARIVTEEQARITGDAANTARIVTAESAIGVAVGRIATEETTRAAGDTALASRIDTVEASVVTANARITSEVSTLVTADTALGTRIDAIVAEIDGSGGATSAEIIAERIARVDADLALGSRIDTVTANTNTETTAIRALVASETSARTTAFGAVSDRFDNLVATFRYEDSLVAATVVAESEARASADEAAALERSALAARIGDAEANILTESEVRTANDVTLANRIALIGARSADGGSFILNTDTVQVSPGVTFGAQQAGILSRLGANEAAIVTERDTRVSQTESIANQVTVLSSNLNGLSASVSTAQSAINGLQAQYGVKLNVNGFITGFVQNNNGTEGSFNILADRFSVVDPNSGPAGTPQTVFEIVNGNTRIRNLIIGQQNVGWGNLDLTQLGRINSNAIIQTTSSTVFGQAVQYQNFEVDMNTCQPSGSFSVDMEITTNVIAPLIPSGVNPTPNIYDSRVYLACTDNQGHPYVVEVPILTAGPSRQRINAVLRVFATTPFRPIWRLFILRGNTNMSEFDPESGQTLVQRSVTPSVTSCAVTARWSFI